MTNFSVDKISLDQKIIDIFGDLVIDKKSVAELKIREAGRTIPSFVEEWLISRYQDPSKSVRSVHQEITDFMSKHLPIKAEKEVIKNRLSNGESVVLLDKFTARVDLAKNIKLIDIPILDAVGQVSLEILNQNKGLLDGGQWGAGRLSLRPEKKDKHVIELIEFRPMQSGRVKLDKIQEARKEFTTEEWIYLLIRTMGYEPASYNMKECCNLLFRLLPLVHKNINMMELAPKSTGKSFIYRNLSRYVWLHEGGAPTQAQLFMNLQTKNIGLIGKYDLVVIDEAQSINFKKGDNIHATFKGYLESGRYSVGGNEVTSECGLMILANIDIDICERKPLREDYIRILPEMFHDDALMDRFHGIIPGWEIPVFSTAHAAQGVGMKADVFGEYAHQLRSVSSYDFPFGKAPDLDAKKIRDKNAVERLSIALSKLLMLNPDHADYDRYVFQPACKLRERVRSQLAALNPYEFTPALSISRK